MCVELYKMRSFRNGYESNQTATSKAILLETDNFPWNFVRCSMCSNLASDYSLLALLLVIQQFLELTGPVYDIWSYIEI